jgi:hypothetical protein
MMLVAKLFIYNTPVIPLNSFSTKVILPFEREEATEPVAKAKLPGLTFSNEKLPKGKTIATKMRKYLRANSYSNIQTTKLHKKAARWFPVIVPILRSYGIPEDFKYMPLVESGLAEGTSPRGASGYWQFMPGTARSYGLRVNSAVDDRKNMRKSTIAACKYLKELHGIFKSWTLAAAAYNIGEINLQRQMARQGQRNYYRMRLNSETASYVYKLIAMKEIIENPIQYGFVSRKTQLLAQKQEYKPAQTNITPKVEQDALRAFAVLQN